VTPSRLCGFEAFAIPKDKKINQMIGLGTFLLTRTAFLQALAAGVGR
jgi:hypothetical protein